MMSQSSAGEGATMMELIDSAATAEEIAHLAGSMETVAPKIAKHIRRIWTVSDDGVVVDRYARELTVEGFECEVRIDLRSFIGKRRGGFPDLLLVDSDIDPKRWMEIVRVARLLNPLIEVVLLGRWHFEGGARGGLIHIYPGRLRELPDIYRILRILND